jgi:hypothetical protein
MYRARVTLRFWLLYSSPDSLLPGPLVVLFSNSFLHSNFVVLGLHTHVGDAMAIERLKHYPHRRNWDKSYDSICPLCYRTIGNRREETELAQDEERHACEGWRLTRWKSEERQVRSQTH